MRKNGPMSIEQSPKSEKPADADRERSIKRLQQALEEVQRLSGFVSVCSHCKKIRDDQGSWMQLEAFIQAHFDARCTHGICPECVRELYPEQYVRMEREKVDRQETGGLQTG
ncbi:MAG TPA: hypothetical protein VL354_15035 [Spirochaetia bacterium]|nr:hypothetical protein [Spirochaetia bacterium]